MSAPRLCGIWGNPYIDLSKVIDTGVFDDLDDEITLALPRAETSYTGGSLKWMGVVAPWAMEDGYVDYMHAIQNFSEEEFRRFVSLGPTPEEFDAKKRSEYSFGDETDHPLTKEQMLYLKVRHNVYFPWKVCYHLLENDRWDDKHSGEGKAFTPEARELFPKTVAFVESLPFREIGRCVLFGLEGNDHAPAHRDSEPGKALSIAQSISFEPRTGKRFYLVDPKNAARTYVESPIYWFNDADYHGVEAVPHFQYSIRVDGTLEPDFVEHLRATFKG